MSVMLTGTQLKSDSSRGTGNEMMALNFRPPSVINVVSASK
jgi:hypothetical protein